MTKEEAQLELLKVELNSIQEGIRSQDTIAFQIKGWCVTAALAIGGFAVSNHQAALALVGIAAVLGFLLVNCQFKAVQRRFIDRNRMLDAELRTAGVMGVLRGAGTVKITGAALPEPYGYERPQSGRVRYFAASLWHEARLPTTFGLYLFLLTCLVAEAIILFLENGT